MRPSIAAGIGVALCAGMAMAQERPHVAPTRDVVVTYRANAPVPGGRTPAGPQTLRMAATQGGRLLRIEGVGAGGTYVIVDRTTQRMVMVIPQDRRFMELPADDAFARGFVLNHSMRFERRGSDKVAGLACTVWEVTSHEGAGTACVTADGVLLRGRGGDGRGGIEATSVRYGPQPAALFRPPTNFTRIEMPGTPPRR